MMIAAMPCGVSTSARESTKFTVEAPSFASERRYSSWTNGRSFTMRFGRVVSDRGELASVLVEHPDLISLAGHVPYPFRPVRAHEKADVRGAGDFRERFGGRQGSIDMTHSHLRGAIGAKEHPRKVYQPFGEPEVVDVVNGQRRHLVHEDVADLRSQSLFRFENLAPGGADGSVFLVERL